MVAGITHGPPQLGVGDSVLRDHSPQHQATTIRMKPRWVTNDGPEHGGQLEHGLLH